jgi:HEAT repeat protein
MDSDEGVRVAAIKALQSIGDPQAVVPLIIVLAHEQVRQRSTGRSSLAVERAASTALDTLCDGKAIEPLQVALKHDDLDVREIAVRRLGRVGSPAVREPLANALNDKDPVIRRAAARGLSELGWQPPANETGARYWAALREWRRVAEAGPDAIPLLVASFPNVDALERTDIIGALVALNWEPPEPDTMAAYFYAAQGKWDKLVEIGEPAVEALEAILKNAPRWRDRVAAAATMETLGQSRPYPFIRLALVQRALGILDADGDPDDKQNTLQALLLEEKQYDEANDERAEYCKCGYPAARVRKDGLREPMADLLGFEKSSSNAITYYCPSCDTRRATVAG